MNDFCNIRTNFNFIFGQFSVARKLILNGGAIRPIGLLFMIFLNIEKNKIFFFSIFHIFFAFHAISNIKKKIGVQKKSGGGGGGVDFYFFI